MPLLALVQPGMAAPAQFRTFQPVQHEQRSLDAAEFLQCQIELVLTPIGRKLLQHDRRRDDPGLQRRDQTNVSFQCSRMTSVLIRWPKIGCKIRIGGSRLDAGQLAIGKVAQPRAEVESEQRAENEDVVRRAARVGVVRVDLQRVNRGATGRRGRTAPRDLVADITLML